MTEEQAFDMAKKARWLRALVGQVESDYGALVSDKLVEPVKGITEFDNLYLFLDLAMDIAASLQALCDQLVLEFE